MNAAAVMSQNNGDVTAGYYRRLAAIGPAGELAVALFRAAKRSNRAKDYRRGRFRRAAYDVKNWSLSEVVRILSTKTAGIAAAIGADIVWGWKEDPATPGYEWVLYVDLPTGQCSFHSAVRLAGPDYAADWDGTHLSTQRIVHFCDQVDVVPDPGTRWFEYDQSRGDV